MRDATEPFVALLFAACQLACCWTDALAWAELFRAGFEVLLAVVNALVADSGRPARGRYGSAMTNGTPQSAPSADWYPDPSAPAQLRFWDGSAWTTHVKPALPAGPDLPAPTAALDAARPAPRKLANRAAGVGVVGLVLSGVGILLALVLGATATNLALVDALIFGGAIVFVLALAFCIVFTIQKR